MVGWGFAEHTGTLGPRDSPPTPTGPPERVGARSNSAGWLGAVASLGFLITGPTAPLPTIVMGTREPPIGQDGAVEVLTLRGPKAREMNEQGPCAPELGRQGDRTKPLLAASERTSGLSRRRVWSVRWESILLPGPGPWINLFPFASAPVSLVWLSLQQAIEPVFQLLFW